MSAPLPEHADRRQAVGSFFVLWAAFELALEIGAPPGAPRRGAARALEGLLRLSLAAAYLATGLALLKGRAGARTPAIALAALLLPRVPWGTVGGLFGLWALLRRSRPGAPAPSPEARRA